jgi:hypothetical protein
MTQINYNIHNKLRIRTDIPLDLPRHFIVNHISNPDLVVERGQADLRDIKTFAPLYTHFGRRKLIHKYGFIFPCELSLENLENKTKIIFTEAYYRMVPSVKRLVESVVNMKLLQRGLIKIHGAGVQLDRQGVLILGWDGSGKSSAVSRLMRAGGRYLGEEHVFIDKNFMYSYPIKIKIFKGHNIISKRLNTVPYLNRFLSVYKHETPTDIAHKTKVKYVFLVKHGKRKIRKISTKELLKDMAILNEYSSGPWVDGKNLILAYSYYNNYDLKRLLNSRQKIMEQFLKGARCYEITSDNVNDLIKSIESVLGV